MFKKGLVIAMSLMMVVSLAGCAAGEKIAQVTGKRSEYEKCRSSYYGTVKLADYSEFKIYEDEYNISDSDVEKQLDTIKSKYKEYEATEDKEVAQDSVVDISYVGTIKVNKEDFAFNGGTADNQKLDIANSAYIEGFAEGLVGHKVGETVDLKLTFPENYSGTTTDADGNPIQLAGEKVKFAVTINSIEKEVTPEVTDEFVAKNLSKKYGVKTAAGLKEYFVNQLRISNVGSTNALGDYIKKCNVKVDEEAVDKEVKKQIDQFKDTLEQSSMTMEDYLKQYADGESEKELTKQVKESVTEQYKTYAVICAVVEKSGKVLKKDRFNDWLSQLVEQSEQYESVKDFLKGYEDYYQSYYGQEINAEDTFTIQCTYLDAMEILMNKTKVNKGTRPEETSEAETEVEDSTEAETQVEE